jgi:anaerobic selenocysteine-containing dehydrogenase/Fe-S-cluster-containing dehydrogenase component
MNRRDFFKIVTTAGATAATAGCQPAGEKILPLVVPSDQLIPGVASWFATVCRECPAGCGVLAKNRDGRVVKLEGNPEHPVNHGALCGRGQAALQTLYHPDRFGGPQRRDGAELKPTSWDEALKSVSDRIGQARGGGKGKAIAVVTQLENGSLGSLLDRWTQALGTRPRATYEPFGHEAQRAANRAVFGRDAIPYHAFEDAEVVVSFGADFLETWISNVGYARGFGRMHTFRDGRAGSFIHVEPRQSMTASSADVWVRNAPGTEHLVALAVLKTLAEAGAVDKRFAEAATVDVKKAAEESGVEPEAIKHIAEALAHAKPALVVGGGAAVTGSHAVALSSAVNLLNAALGAVGKTVRFGPDSAYGRVTPYADITGLVQAMANGEIDVLLLGANVNPAFTLPGGLKFEDAVKKVSLVVSFANRPDETTALAHVVLPDTHWLESWGDYAPREGVAGLLQPTMMPIRDARSLGDVMLSIGRAVLGVTEEGKGPLPWATFEAFVKAAWEPVVKGQWAATLEQGGMWRETAATAVTAKIGPVGAEPAKLEGDAGGLALLAYPSFRFFDGRSAGNAWLQEVPDTMTQTAWDAWIEVPAEVAAARGIVNGDVVRVSSPHGAVELPAYVSASIHPKAVAIPIGHRYAPYHLRNGRYVTATSTPMNPAALLPPAPEAGGGVSYLSVRVTLAKTGARRPLAILQGTHDQEERELVRHVDLRAAREQALRGKREEHGDSGMYPPQQYPGYRWGMSVDVDACIGCQACTVACIAENNIPVVGKAQAAYGRQVHWLRVERWADGKPSAPHNAFLPMFCQHCEVAPCEPVCPVFAAYRTEEGLNGQVYNRCVGTRYCGNNCPYHVRRFNWFSYEFPAPLEVQLNPEVTVRQLGVMEKCTMCIQRIVAGKDRARDEKRPVKDGDIMTACQQTCPTHAITFGNLKDPQSAVAKHRQAPRAYDVLDELGTRPSVTYLKKVTREHA